VIGEKCEFQWSFRTLEFTRRARITRQNRKITSELSSLTPFHSEKGSRVRYTWPMPQSASIARPIARARATLVKRASLPASRSPRIQGREGRLAASETIGDSNTWPPRARSYHCSLSLVNCKATRLDAEATGSKQEETAEKGGCERSISSNDSWPSDPREPPLPRDSDYFAPNRTIDVS